MSFIVNEDFMKRIPAIILYVFSCCCFESLHAQGNDLPQIYYLRNDVKVIANGVTKVSPWSGGLNNPQFAMADLNRDGKQDLVIYEDYIGVKTFINTGSIGNPNYVYDGNYEAFFPKKLRSFMKLVDYNRDGTMDLIDYGAFGFGIYTGHYTSGTNAHLEFQFYKLLFYDAKNGPINAYSPPPDVPIVYDADTDGDIDFLAFDIGGSVLGHYRNCQVEDGLPPDSIKICYADKCWGRFKQEIDRKQRLAYPCIEENKQGTTCKGGSGNKTTDANNSLCMVDIDGDGDFDILNGNIQYSDMQLLINGKSDYNLSLDSMIDQDTVWGANGVDVKVDKYPAAFHLDVDQDGDKDLLISPMAKENENYKSVWYYKNTGSDASPNFKFQTNTFLVDDMIDVGSNARPAFYDYNKDGKPDLFIGTGGLYQGNSTFKTTISYYRNISEKGFPTYELVTTDFMNLSTQNLSGASLAFGDLDGDGKDDMVIGLEDGTINFYKNNAASNTVQNNWQYVAKLRCDSAAPKNIDVGYAAAPLIYDVDKDGRPDLVVGSEYGELYYYRYTGNATAAFSLITNELGGIAIKTPGGYLNKYSAPFIGPVDDSKKEYLLIGSGTGQIYIYDGFQDGYDSAKKYTLLDEDYQYIYAGTQSVPAAADIDADGKYELLVGIEQGGINLYRQLYDLGTQNHSYNKTQVKVYPNPAHDILNLSWSESFAQDMLDISLVTVTGQQILQLAAPAAQGSVRLDISGLPSGVYYAVIQSAVNRTVSPVTIVR